MSRPRKSREEWLSFYKEIATSRGGACLSDHFVSGKLKLHWLCAEGHEWEAIPDNVRAGHWCKDCGNKLQGQKKAKTIQWAHQLAADKGGSCLSSEYRNTTTKLHWRCAQGHEWSAVAGAIQQGTWCPVCAGKKPADMALNELREVAKSRGGECMSDSFWGVKSKMRWRCMKGHEWEAVPDSVRRGTWCPKCIGTVRLTIEDMQETARLQGGQCLSEHYSNADQKVHWRCAAGHEWWAVPYHVRAGHWCPICSAGKSERICKNIFEQMFGRAFPKAKPTWLKGAKGRTMELDGYCEELAIAFEYHGIQHYEAVDFFHRGEKSLEKRRHDDAHKERICSEHDVYLFVVPHTVPMADVPNFVFRKAKEMGLSYPMKSPDEIKVADNVLPEMIAAMKEMAKKRGGECLSTNYVNNNTKLRWRCGDGHEWEAVPGSLQQGSWCPSCAGRLPAEEAINSLHAIASSKGGACLSDVYVSAKDKLEWRCAKGHQWKAPPDAIRSGRWCPKCANDIRGPKRKGIEVCQQAAIKKGGICLSTTYVSTDKKLRWQCAVGHEWQAIPDSVVRLGTWCPKCKGKRILEARRSNAVRKVGR